MLVFVLVMGPVNSVFAAPPDAPTSTGGEELVMVSDYEPGATLRLYLWSGSLVDTAAAVMTPTYTFEDIAPNSEGFYVTQTVGGAESVNSAYTGVSLRTPNVSAGIGYIDVSNVRSGATVTLHESNGTPVSSVPTDQGNGVWRFDGLTPRAEYYAQQSINGVQSGGSSLAMVQPYIPAAPSATAGEESVEASGYEPGATLRLYLGDGTLADTAVSVTDPTYTFEDVEPDSRAYYITQEVGGEESQNSSFVGPSLRTPSASAGIGYIDVSNVRSGATVTLYESNGTPVSSAPTDQGNGVWRFGGLTPRAEYYALQSINNVTSTNSSFVIVLAQVPTAPTATGGEEQVMVSDYESGATLRLYLSDGTLVDTATSITDSTYTFEEVVPHHLGFYVTQTVGVETSVNSTFVDVSLRRPVASAGIRSVDALNIIEGATLELYDSEHELIEVDPVRIDDVWRYSDLTNGKTYYVIQVINGVRSLNSTFATLPEPPSAPRHVQAAAGNGQAVVSFSAPLDSGRSEITGYEVIAYPGGAVVASGQASPITVTGLSNGTSYTFSVVAINATGRGMESAPSASVTPFYPYSNNWYEPTIQPTAAEVIINGRVEKIGRILNSTSEGRSVSTVVVDRQEMQKRLEGEAVGVTIVIPVLASSDVLIGELNAQLMEALSQKQAIIELRTDRGAYRLPASEVSINELQEKLGVAAENISIRLVIAAPKAAVLKQAEQAAANGVFTLLSDPVEFAVYGVHDGKMQEVTGYNVYVERTIVLPAGVGDEGITTGIVIAADGTIRHIPSRVTVENDRYTVIMNSLTNSAYAVIWHPVTFDDVRGHWVEAAANDLASRLVVAGIGEGRFEPNRTVTRGEFTAMLVRALGLGNGSVTGAASFGDVSKAHRFAGAIHSAVSLGLLEGFEDGSFRPGAAINREQAMTILAKAMRVTALSKTASADQMNEFLGSYADASAIAGWAKRAVADTIAAGLVEGRSATQLAPKAEVTRAEAAAMIHRLLQASELIDR